MPPKKTTEVKYYTLTDSGYIEIDAPPQELETYLEESQEWQRVRHGHWRADETVYTTGEVWCSVCRTLYYIGDLYNVGENAQSNLPNYCPHCGAKMD